MDKAYEPQKHENDIYEKWESSGAFQPSDSQKTFTIPIPPPNVTGTLHAGHSLFITLQDILIRWHRMMGDASLWVPGTDHAAIATESVVLKNLGIEDRNKEISREDFMKEAEKWTKKTHARITEQIKKMGASCDWTREAYTFDKPRNKAVITIFQMLYDKGLIYRGKPTHQLVYWCAIGFGR
jgi:valyl-tRNA synthetase